MITESLAVPWSETPTSLQPATTATDTPTRLTWKGGVQSFLQQCASIHRSCHTSYTQDRHLARDSIVNFRNQYMLAGVNPDGLISSLHQQRFSISGPQDNLT
jgi:hypothetical protein